MGTRNLTCVVKDGDYKIAQYCQWDGYPEGQGLRILDFLRNNKLEKFKAQVDKCSFIEEQDFFDNAYEELGINVRNGCISFEDAAKFASVYPQLSRDMGAGVLEFVLNNDNVLLKNSIDFSKDSLFCEWAYVVDLDNNTFEVYEGFNKEPLSENERFYGLADEDGYYPVKHVITFDINSLPNEKEFLSHFIDDEENSDDDDDGEDVPF